MPKKPNNGPGGTRHVGRLRIAAAKILTKSLGFEVHPDDIKPATGSWRTNWQLDVYRWELYTDKPSAVPGGNPMPLVAGCWESLTDFVRLCRADGGICHLTKNCEIYPGAEHG